MNSSKKRFKGKMVEPPQPLNWKPLVELAGKRAEDFMLMFDVELKNGPRLTAFEHRWTRGYLDLILPHGRRLAEYREFQERARQDSNLWPIAPEAIALSS